MVSAGLQILGAALGILGWIGAIVVCAIPMWKVTAFIGSNIVTSQTSWEGIWMNCVHQSTGQMQCKVYDSMLALPQDLQAARALVIISIVVGILAILLSIAGGSCTNCVEDPASKTKVGIAAGVLFIIAGVLCLVPVCWTAHTIIRDFYNPLLVSARLGTIITCAMPMWRVTAFVGANIVTAQTIWEGLWMTCVVQSTGQMQCKVYDSMLALPQDLQAARAMVVISVIVGVFGVLMAVVGGKCTNCMEDETAKAKACIVSGVVFIIAALLIMIPVSWSAHAVIRDFYNPLVTAAQRRELGAALYIGWGAAGLLLLGGGLLCNNCPRKDGTRPYIPAKFTPGRTASSNVDYEKRHYITNSFPGVVDLGAEYFAPLYRPSLDGHWQQSRAPPISSSPDAPQPTQRHGHQTQSSTQQEEDPPRDGHSGFGRLVPDAGGALRSDDRQQQAEQGEEDGDDHHGAGGLQVRGQPQQRVVHLALHLAGALHHAAHPQALPDGLSHHDLSRRREVLLYDPQMAPEEPPPLGGLWLHGSDINIHHAAQSGGPPPPQQSSDRVIQSKACNCYGLRGILDTNEWLACGCEARSMQGVFNLIVNNQSGEARVDCVGIRAAGENLDPCGSLLLLLLTDRQTNMASAGLQILGVFLATVGFLGDIIICALPMWKVSAFIGNNIVTAQTFWEGLWMNCVKQSTGQMQCKVYDSMLALPRDLQAARALVVISILVALMGILLSVAGGKCTNCIEDEDAKSKVAISAGVFFIVGGLLCLIPVSWSAHVVIRNFYNPIMSDPQRRELGAALFIGWGSAGILLIGGALLCCQCRQRSDSRYSAKYSAPRSAASGAYV
ncbi:uncharacterized protein LOC131986229 [Centropristis striata]|uniref:uncharacterized protein LOC131986229 n=1 Tax=Centropristis striata TaxID=184440 RepID=UPI0027E16B4B|nr:uncharacterized protein LOC131986229 [Centropristis striata]